MSEPVVSAKVPETTQVIGSLPGAGPERPAPASQLTGDIQQQIDAIGKLGLTDEASTQLATVISRAQAGDKQAEQFIAELHEMLFNPDTLNIGRNAFCGQQATVSVLRDEAPEVLAAMVLGLQVEERYEVGEGAGELVLEKSKLVIDPATTGTELFAGTNATELLVYLALQDAANGSGELRVQEGQVVNVPGGAGAGAGFSAFSGTYHEELGEVLAKLLPDRQVVRYDFDVQDGQSANARAEVINAHFPSDQPLLQNPVHDTPDSSVIFQLNWAPEGQHSEHIVKALGITEVDGEKFVVVENSWGAPTGDFDITKHGPSGMRFVPGNQSRVMIPLDGFVSAVTHMTVLADSGAEIPDPGFAPTRGVARTLVDASEVISVPTGAATYGQPEPEDELLRLRGLPANAVMGELSKPQELPRTSTAQEHRRPGHFSPSPSSTAGLTSATAHQDTEKIGTTVAINLAPPPPPIEASRQIVQSPPVV